jgi:hypothetical protein
MRTGVQFTGTLAAREQNRWTSNAWPAAQHVVWTIVPTSPRSGAAQLEWSVSVERSSAEQCAYWVTVKNLTASSITFEGRYAVLN